MKPELEFKPTNKYKKDLSLMVRQGKDVSLLDAVVDKLCKQESLEPKYRDHPLHGNYVGHRECHIEPDWLLIYRVSEKELILTAVRTGSHSNLLKK
ncbi:MAG: type II toxin-antitoxin system YafQ family toxin [Fibromonadales bacterium]|nr:type II toxin-antitoxin system YafQ family toxin [Fibromonadales bacterium]